MVDTPHPLPTKDPREGTGGNEADGKNSPESPAKPDLASTYKRSRVLMPKLFPPSVTGLSKAAEKATRRLLLREGSPSSAKAKPYLDDGTEWLVGAREQIAEATGSIGPIEESRLIAAAYQRALGRLWADEALKTEDRQMADTANKLLSAHAQNAGAALDLAAKMADRKPRRAIDVLDAYAEDVKPLTSVPNDDDE